MLGIVPVVPVTPPSRRSRELGVILSEAIRIYEREHPAISRDEVRTALRLAGEDRAGPPAGPIAAVLGGLTALGLVAFLLYSSTDGGGGAGTLPPWTAMAVVFGLTLAVLVFFLRRRGP